MSIYDIAECGEVLHVSLANVADPRDPTMKADADGQLPERLS